MSDYILQFIQIDYDKKSQAITKVTFDEKKKDTPVEKKEIKNQQPTGTKLLAIVTKVQARVRGFLVRRQINLTDNDKILTTHMKVDHSNLITITIKKLNAAH